MRCEEVREMLPDNALGTLTEVQEAAVRRHLRGCGACRSDAMALDRGVAMFASAAHDLEPPPDLRGRVMTAMQEERADADAAPAAAPARGRRLGRWLAVAAALVMLAGALAWALTSQSNLSRERAIAAAAAGDAASYRSFLHTLGGTEVRVGTFRPSSAVPVEGSAILYDSDKHQSWGLIMVTAPGYQGDIQVTLVSTSGRTITLADPITLDSDWQGDAWLVTSADITSFQTVRLTGASGELLAIATTPPRH